MTSRDFCYWLQGHLEIAKPQSLDKSAVEMIQKHLNMVFKHEIDPSFGEHLSQLRQMHDSHAYDNVPITC